jgi:hypothetical protein
MKRLLGRIFTDEYAQYPVYRDFGRPNAGLEQARAIVAAKIISVLDARKLSTRDAERLTGVSHSEFSRIRNTQLRRFTDQCHLPASPARRGHAAPCVSL